MKRKTWVSIACGGLLILATAMPATAAGWDLFQPRPAVLEVVMDWFAGWMPENPDTEVESRFAAGNNGKDGPGDRGMAPMCEGCPEDESGSYADPDG